LLRICHPNTSQCSIFGSTPPRCLRNHCQNEIVVQNADIYATIRPIDGSRYQYILTLENRGEEAVANGVLDYGPALHPGNFGLDDTHMPADIWIKPPVVFESLAPGERVTFEVDGYDLQARFVGKLEQWCILKTTYPPCETRVLVAIFLVNEVEAISREQWRCGYEERSVRVDRLAVWEKNLPWVAVLLVLLLWIFG